MALSTLSRALRTVERPPITPTHPPPEAVLASAGSASTPFLLRFNERLFISALPRKKGVHADRMVGHSHSPPRFGVSLVSTGTLRPLAGLFRLVIQSPVGWGVLTSGIPFCGALIHRLSMLCQARTILHRLDISSTASHAVFLFHLVEHRLP